MYHLSLLAAFVAVLGWSAWRPHDYPTWIMETFPAIAGALVLVATWRRFRLTNLLYWLLLAHAVILCVGGKYTYALNPPFAWLQQVFDLQRNYYDRLGHFTQGFVPAILAREVLVRRSPLRPGGWLSFTVISFCLALSACYEFVEWWAALLLGQGADAFLGTQGDPWDTQWDMFLCLVGASVAVAAFSGVHDRALLRLGVDLGPARRAG